jgi:flagellar assembly protein FliH
MIKAYSVRYDEVIKKTIDTHLRINKEIEVKRFQVLQPTEAQDDFIEGLQALVIEAIPTKDEVAEQSSVLIEDAKNEAERILLKAKKDAEKLKKEAFAAGQKNGFDEGALHAKRDLQKRKAEYDEKETQLQKEYSDMALTLDHQMAEIIVSLVEKITGIIVDEKEEVILYLVEKALKNMDKQEEYTIRVSKEDYEYVSVRKNRLLGAIGREVPIYITEDASLQKNMCLIETELRVINCSLDVQLNNLITDLKLIGGI